MSELILAVRPQTVRAAAHSLGQTCIMLAMPDAAA
jgi:hypothetical protein